MDIFGSIGLGAITGLVGPIITGITNYKMKKLEGQMRIDELKAESENMRLESQMQIEVTKEKTKGEVEIAELDAFKESIKQSGKSLFQESYMQALMRRKGTAWLGAIVASLFGFVDFLKGLARPVITYYLIGVSTWVTVIAYEILNKTQGAITTEWAQGIFEKVILTIIYMTVSCVGWWFADRRIAKFMTKHLEGKK